jgi:hypothetical protein
MPYLANNTYYTPHGNASLRCGKQDVGLATLQKGGAELGSVAKGLPEDSDWLALAADLLKRY